MMKEKEYKGMRTFPPDKHENLSRILDGWTEAAGQYGFLQYKTALIDPIERYKNKTSEEILREQTYKFTDRGKRRVVLRPEITPGAAAMVAKMQKNRTLHLPFKGFTIGSVFRYERPQKGRSREHIQFNADIFGEENMWADAEIVEVAFAALEAVGFKKDDFVARVNDRKAMAGTLTRLGMPEERTEDVFRLLDRREKMDPRLFEREMQKTADIPVDVVDARLRETPASARELLNLLPKDVPAQYDPGITRGFDYYTGIVFEIFAKNRDIAPRSIAGGGRYDTLVESCGGNPVPAVGFGMGDVALLNCLEALEIEPAPKDTAVIVYTTTGNIAAARKVSGDIREHFPTSFIGAIPGKNLGGKYRRFEKQGIRYAIDAHGTKDITVKNLRARETIPYSSPHAIIRDIKRNIPAQESLMANSGGSLMAQIRKCLRKIKRS